jgi:hypothetical protein
MFISTHCKHCQRLLNEHPHIQNEYSFVDVDSGQCPEFLRVVPTLVVVTDDGQTVYEGTDVFRFVQDRPQVEAYSFSCSNTTNKGFSFIDTDHPVYSEQCNYTQF